METQLKKLTMENKKEALKILVDSLYEDEYYSSSPKQDLFDLYDEIYDISLQNGSIIAICEKKTKNICGVAVFVDINKIKDNAETFDFVLGVENEEFREGVEKFNEIMLQDSSSTYLYGVAVDSKYRGQGLGIKLLQGSFDILVNKTVYADVTHDSILEFYKKIGFEIIPVSNMFLIKKECKKA